MSIMITMIMMDSSFNIIITNKYYFVFSSPYCMRRTQKSNSLSSNEQTVFCDEISSTQHIRKNSKTNYLMHKI